MALFVNLSMELGNTVLDSWLPSGARRLNSPDIYIKDGSYFMDANPGSWGAPPVARYQTATGVEVTALIGRRIRVGGWFLHHYRSYFQTWLALTAYPSEQGVSVKDDSREYKYDITDWLTIPAGTTSITLTCRAQMNSYNPMVPFDALEVEIEILNVMAGLNPALMELMT